MGVAAISRPAIDWSEVRRLFDLVCERPESDWLDLLQAEGASDVVSREVLELCRVQTRGAALPRPVAKMLASLDPELPAGTRLGPWRLLSTLAEGGMGRVYLAERADGQYEMKVAIKRLRALGAAEEHALLRRERQILADLVHPHIARLLDGGVSPNGQPHLVMEYIEGRRIDHWCASGGLALSARLRLFMQVARAVAHAHRHLVLHCDIKPSNVLVRSDGTPVLLDFGIARLLDSEGREAGGQGYMTPRYASPEQKRGEPLSAATDIYSLGLLLSELLAPDPDSKPESASTDTPPTQPPSGRAVRSGLPWARHLRGDLDSIVMRACAADPARRYDSAESLAADIERHLERRPVAARRGAPGYHLLRLLQRRWPVFTAGAVMLAMAAGFTFSLQLQLERARTAEQMARVEVESNRQTVQFLLGVFEHADPELGSRADTTARELLDSARRELDAGLPADRELRMRLALTLGQIYYRIGLPAEALQLLRTAQSLAPSTLPLPERLQLEDSLAQALLMFGEQADAEHVARQALALAEARLDPNDLAVGNALNTLGLALNDRQRVDEASTVFRRALAIREEAAGIPSIEVASTLHNLGLVERRAQRLDSAETYLRRSLAIKAELYPPEHVRNLVSLEVLASVYTDRADFAAAEALLLQLRGLRVAIHGEENARVSRLDNELGSTLQDQGRYVEAEAFYRRALAANRRLFGDDTSEVALVLNNLASLRESQGALADASALLRESLQIRLLRLGPEHPGTARVHHNLARVLLARGQHAEAVSELRKALDIRQQQLGPEHPETQGSRILEALLLMHAGDIEKARSQLRQTQLTLEAHPFIEGHLHLRLLDAQARVALAAEDTEGARLLLNKAIEVISLKLSPTHPMGMEYRLRAELLKPPPDRDDGLIEQLRVRLQEVLSPDHPLLAGARS
ncbi:MAG: serine/threonine-protein kinase [Aquimonas sp.]|nr:serine/threonine-protein kinase [Aquimonas sp.]